MICQSFLQADEDLKEAIQAYRHAVELGAQELLVLSADEFLPVRQLPLKIEAYGLSDFMCLKHFGTYESYKCDIPNTNKWIVYITVASPS